MLYLSNWGLRLHKPFDFFFKQVVLTKSIPFSIENQSINLDQLNKIRKLKQQQNTLNNDTEQPTMTDQESVLDDDHLDLFEELNAILGESNKT